MERLASYLFAVTGREPSVTEKLSSSPAAIILTTSRGTLDATVSIDNKTSESFSIATFSRGNNVQVTITGASALGVKRGVYHLMQSIELHDGKLMMPSEPVTSAPFLRSRVSHVGGYTVQHLNVATGEKLAKGTSATREQSAWNLLPFWEPDRIGEYVDMLDFFGYNGIEAPPSLYDPKDTDTLSLQRRKVLRQHATENGMKLVLKLDGTLFGRGGAVPYGPDTKARYNEHYRSYAEVAAPDIDDVLTHWVDAGGWKSTPDHPCSIDLLQDLHMQIDAEFRRVNPHVQSFLNLWYLDHPGYQRWLGYQNVDTILSSGKIPPQVGIAMGRYYKPAEAKQIVAAGHPAGVWSWYMADNELLYTMHVHTHILQSYLASLPPEASDELALHVMDNCQRETNLYSIYLAAHLMWEPKLDPDIPLREVARLVYGPKLEDAVFHALKAIADVRCGAGPCRGMWTAGATRDRITSNAVVSFDQGYQQATDAWKALKDAQPDEHYIAPVKFHRATATLLAELKNHAEIVASYMQFLKDRRDGNPHPTEVPHALGPFEAYERMRFVTESQTTATVAI